MIRCRPVPAFVRRATAATAPVLSALLLAGCASVGLKLPDWLVEPRGAVATPATAPAGGLQWGDPVPGAAQATAQAAPTAGPPAADAAYEIGPEDGLEITVWKDDALKSTVVVRPDGGISLPLVGEVRVAGRTAAQVRDEIARRLDKFIAEPVVNVSVVRVASYRIYVIGRVNRPGEFPLGRTVDVLQALTLAGGMTPFAVEDEIRIVRKINGQSITLPFDYKRVRKGGDLSQNIMLRSGDVVLVP